MIDERSGYCYSCTSFNGTLSENDPTMEGEESLVVNLAFLFLQTALFSLSARANIHYTPRFHECALCCAKALAPYHFNRYVFCLTLNTFANSNLKDSNT